MVVPAADAGKTANSAADSTESQHGHRDHCHHHSVRGDDRRPDLAAAGAGPRHPPASGQEPPREWVDVPTHCVLVDTLDGRLLWDTSCPRDWEQRWEPTGLQDFFPYDKVSDDEYLDSRLKQLGLAPGDLDYVVFSHLHFDHAGNAQMFKDTNARLVCSDKEKEFALGFDGLFTGAHLKTDYEGLDFETVSGDAEFLPGVSFIQTPAPPAACRCGSTCPRPAR